MTIDEAIKHCLEVVQEHTKYNSFGGFESCDECAKEHRQLAEWLTELKEAKYKHWAEMSEEEILQEMESVKEE